MKRNLIAALAAACVVALILPAQAGDIIAEWGNVKAPPPPALKEVTVDAKTTALLMLDFLTVNCPKRPRCVDSLPAMQKLLGEARTHHVAVIYTTFPKMPADMILKDVAPQAGETIVGAVADKFLNSDLQKMLKDKGITTVITVGTAAHGAVLYTASIAALLGLKVIVPVDGMSSENLYFEQISAWLLANGTGGIGPKVTLTRTDMIKF